MAAEGKQISGGDVRKEFGYRGEDLAAVFFESRGFEILKRNWTCRVGEIDIVCRRGKTLHFVEVKIRRTREFGYPEGAVTAVKLRHLARAVETYLRSVPGSGSDYQIDVLAITSVPGEKIDFHFVENVGL